MGFIETLIIILVGLFLIGLILHLVLWLTWLFLILAAGFGIYRFFKKWIRKLSPRGKKKDNENSEIQR